MRRYLLILPLLAIALSACVTDQPVRGTDPEQWLKGAASRGPVKSGTYEYDDASARMQWPDPPPERVIRGIDAEVSDRGLTLPGGGEEAAGFREEYADYGYLYDDDPYDNYRPRRRPGRRPGTRPGDRPKPPEEAEPGRPPREGPGAARPDEPPERRDRVKNPPKRPERESPRRRK